MHETRNKVRFVTAASLFDGHDAAINIIRRLLQAHGAEVVHLGHDRSVADIVDAAIQEDAQGIAVSSYQGGHMEFFTYMVERLREAGRGDVRVFGGGGGVIVPDEAAELHRRGVARIFSPDDGRRLGLDGMIDEMMQACDFVPGDGDGEAAPEPPDAARPGTVARWISRIEAGHEPPAARGTRPPVVGVTGTGGAGKSTLIDELVRRFLADFPAMRLAVVAVDPTRRRSGGALLGDRIRMNALAASDRVFMRSLATRQAHRSLPEHAGEAVAVCAAAGYDLVILESAGTGQADSEIADFSDLSIYAMTPEYGAGLQLEKIDMLDFASLVAINKFDRAGALDALRDVRKQVRRCREAFDAPDEALPVHATCAHQFHDPGVNGLYQALLGQLEGRFGGQWRPAATHAVPVGLPKRHALVPADRSAYLREIADACRGARARVESQASVARRLWQLAGALDQLLPVRRDAADDPLWAIVLESEGSSAFPDDPPAAAEVRAALRATAAKLDRASRDAIAGWQAARRAYAGDELAYGVRGKTVRQPLRTTSLAGTAVPRVCLPDVADWGAIVAFRGLENVPGEHPYTAGVFPLKRTEETPTRMFAGEGGPERTNRRFHYLAAGQPSARLSTAFDSPTLYGRDPAERPDIFGKIGESGVSIATVEDMERLYEGFDLCSPSTSVSMTINGPAPMILAMFMNVAGRQEARRRMLADGRLTGEPGDALKPAPGGLAWEAIAPRLRPGEWDDALACAMRQARGTVQADILKEDQAQNTCIFSTEFALRMMADVQASFIRRDVRNFYSVSISGYHIAEAGANPITQLAFTLANGFTYVEYYLARGLAFDDFAQNLSFFFSNGMDAEYAVIGRVARRIWATVARERFGGSERSAKLKYHIQTSGRSLHAQEISFNDIRTTLQALLAIADNCSSLHTNAYDEAITTPTEESVRRAVAIQMIANLEFGLLKNENPWQGSYFLEWLTDAVEAAVLEEFRRISERGGVAGAMETGYQRSRIQEESLHYEQLKHSGELPIVGVNTFLDANRADGGNEARELTRATVREKIARIDHVRDFQARHADGRAGEAPWDRPSAAALARLAKVAVEGGNLFEELLSTVCACSLGQISEGLFGVGGRYRRGM